MSAKKILLAQFDLHQVLFNNVLADINEEESNKSMASPMNSIKWLAGHLLWAQHSLAIIGNVKIDLPWRDHFYTEAGATDADRNAAPSKMPTLQMIRDKWNEDAPEIKNDLEALPEEALNAVINAKHPISPFDNTLGGKWAFTNHHQAYTIGQIGILRRGLGKEGMKYFSQAN
jgi:hypothetical protein